MRMRMRALELYCGIGGFAAAVARRCEISLAIDQSSDAVATYELNFGVGHARQMNLEDVTPERLDSARAQLWWMSPPCQPYTVRGARRDLTDPRAKSFRRILGFLAELKPEFFCLENVEGFVSSEARTLLVNTLKRCGYTLLERLLCPTELGVPNRRPRYYLVASRGNLKAMPKPRVFDRALADYLNDLALADQELVVKASVIDRFGAGLRVLDPGDPRAYTTCFTSGYGRSLMHAGAYLRTPSGIRRFSPEEIAALLHFPTNFSFPAKFDLRKRWKLVGNSLSVAAVREVLRVIPQLED